MSLEREGRTDELCGIDIEGIEGDLYMTPPRPLSSSLANCQLQNINISQYGTREDIPLAIGLGSISAQDSAQVI